MGIVEGVCYLVVAVCGISLGMYIRNLNLRIKLLEKEIRKRDEVIGCVSNKYKEIELKARRVLKLLESFIEIAEAENKQ